MKRLSKQSRGRILSLSFIALTFIFVVVFIFKTGDLKQIAQAFRSINPYWFAAAVGCFAVQAFFEGWSISLFFKFYGIRLRLGAGVLVGLLGMYYGSITPSAAGAQPMQLFSLKKRGVPPGIASSVLAVKFFCWQLSFMLAGSVLWAMHGRLVYDTIGRAGIWLLIVGYLVNFLMVGAVILLSISRNLVRAIIIFFVKFAHRLRYVKDVAATSSRWDAALSEFHSSVEMITRHPFQFLLIFFMSLVESVTLQSVVYFVYRGFGLAERSYFSILTIQFLLYIVASSTPLPGDSGAQEGGFYFFFEKFFPSGTIFAALILWRSITFYLQIICGFTAAIIDQALSGRRARRKKRGLAEQKEEEEADFPEQAEGETEPSPQGGEEEGEAEAEDEPPASQTLDKAEP